MLHFIARILTMLVYLILIAIALACLSLIIEFVMWIWS